ncbi:MAG: hypothetical protein ABIO79_08500 [Ferruginibacter sp.]
MKIIKSFFLFTLSLCATTLLHAQEAIVTPVKPVTSPVPALVVKPASALKTDENIKNPEEPKPVLKVIDGTQPAKPLTDEQKKIMEGKSEKIIQPVLMPSSIGQNVKRELPAKPVAKEQ